MIPEAAEEAIRARHPKLMYIIPTFQNPTGVTLSLERRKALAELANRCAGVILAEDDPYRDLRYAGEPLPAIKSFDEGGWVVYLASFSKLISPGMRVGAAICNPVLMRKLVIGKQSTDVHTTSFTQAIVDLYLRKNLLLPHIERICKSYERQLRRHARRSSMFPRGRDAHRAGRRPVRVGGPARRARARFPCSTARWKTTWPSCPARTSIPKAGTKTRSV